MPYTFEPHDVVLNAQKHNLEIIGDLELLHRSHHGVKTIGITGTNGKSTTTALITHVLNECGMKAVMGGNIGKAVLELDLDNVDILVLEISSYQMDLCPTYRPDISLVLNITPDHLDRHGSMKDYIAAKAKILEGDCHAIVSVDDDFTMKLFDGLFCAGREKITPVSTRGVIPEGIFVKNHILYQNNKGEDIEIGNLSGLNTLRGVHNKQNCAFCYVVAAQLGLDADAVLQAFATYPGLPHRQYLITQQNGVTYINDSKATNAEAAAKALASYDNIYWVLGGRAKASEGKIGLEGLEIFKDKVIKAFVIGEAQEAFAPWLQYHGFDFELCGDLDNATQKAYEAAAAREGEVTVLLSPACASWDQFKSFEARGDDFTKTVLDLIGEK